jgi:hypothetical protein
LSGSSGVGFPLLLPPAGPPPPSHPASSNNSAGSSTSGSHLGASVPWGVSVTHAPTPTSVDKFAAITHYVETEWSEKDRKELKNHALKLWKQYHKTKDAHMTSDELFELTKDSLTTLQRHISLFINNSYEEMKKHTQVCMINLLQCQRSDESRVLERPT